MHNVFFIPGLGTDRRIFKELSVYFEDFHQHYIEYIAEMDPAKGESIPEYARRLFAAHNVQDGDWIIGMSLGGVIANEAARLYPHAKVFIISTIKSEKEIPLFFRILRRIPLQRVLPTFMTRIAAVWLSRFQIPDKEGRKRFRDMVYSVTDRHFYWGRNAIINWRNEEIPANLLLHVHGTKDGLFSHRNMPDAHIIEGGTHWMVVDRAHEVATAIRSRGLTS